jgi:phosphoribosyl-dephospho-CoA transferase
MNLSEIGDPQVHDLLRIDPDCLTAGCVAPPSWARESFITCPWAVVRRAQAPVGQLAVGVRGATRSERWGGFCAKSLISKIVRPAELLVLARSSTHILRTPAFRMLQQIIESWHDLTLLWGPTGSVGFELATGRQVTTEASDLDIAIRAPHRIDLEQARSLWHRVTEMQTKVDVRVETPECGFSLEEYACSASSRNSRILLRYPDSSRFGDDPWRDCSKLEATAS